MAILNRYLKPQSLPEALDLLRQTGGSVPLAGGTHLVGALETRRHRDVDGVIDLAGLGLDFMDQEGQTLRVGAMTTLSQLVEHPLAASIAGGILPRTARFEGPLNLRNAATVGGLVALAEPDSELYGALLALGGSVVTAQADGSHHETALEAWRSPTPPDSGFLITEVQLPLTPVQAGHARIARTPQDRCIVAAVAVRSGEQVRVALCGVDQRPVLADETPNPQDDWKASAEYRLAMAEVVQERAVAEIGHTQAVQDAHSP